MTPPRLLEESFTLRRVARRFGWRPRIVRPETPERPLGLKLELTHACNLRCGFCYTDSPRHTLARTPDLSDDDWLSVVDQAIALGVIETVLTGGEPLLRRELLVRIIDRLETAGVRMSLNTNGWFVDERFAKRLARVPGIHAHVSIDGATPESHDSSRGLPGSWRRAVRAVDLFLEQGVQVHVAHVVTPQNEDSFTDFLEQMWTLGVTSVRVTPVVPTGAAARHGRWDVDRGRLRRAAESFTRRHGEEMRIRLRPGTAAGLATPEDAAPQAMLVRPSGAVRTDSLHPFAFGHALEDGLNECWRRIVAGWRDPEITEWSKSLRSTRALPGSELVAYLDDDPPVGQAGPGRDPSSDGSARPRGRGRPLRHRRRSRAAREQALSQPLPSPVGTAGPNGRSAADPEEAAAYVRRLALSRPYRLGSVRCTPGGRERYVSRIEGGDVVRLNRTAALVMDALDRGTPRDAVELLVARHPNMGRDQLERDVLDSARSLVSRRVVVPASVAVSPRA